MGFRRSLQPFLFQNFEQYLDNEEAYVLPFPSQWWEVIEKEKNEYLLPFKPKLLASRLQSIFPDIVMVNNTTNVLSNGDSWIVSMEPLNIKAILIVVLSCISNSNLNNKDNLLINDELNWEKKKLVELKDLNDFEIYPAFLAHKFCAESRELSGIETLKNRKISFLKVKSNQSYEVVSEPLTIEKQGERFSYVIRFELKTRGIENTKLLKVTPGSRRYYQKENENPHYDVKYGVKIAAYISQNQIFSQNKSRSLGKFFFSKKGNQLIWSDGIGEIIKELYPDFPTLQEILKNSEELLCQENKILVGYSDRGFKAGTKVKAGISVQERNSLVEAVYSTFAKLYIVDKHYEVKLPRRSMGKKPYQFFYHADTGNELDMYLYISEELYKEALVKWQENGFIFFEDGSCFLNSKPVFKMNFHHMGDHMIYELPLEDGEINKAIRLYERELKEHLPQYSSNRDSICNAIVEIEPYHEMVIKAKDPKHVLRTSFAKRQVVSQFVHPIEKDTSFGSRIKSAFLDLLADTGFFHGDLEEPLFNGETILSLNLVKRNKSQYLPVLSKIIKNKIVYKTPIRNDWVEISDYLTSKYSDQSFYNKNKTDQLKRWLESEIIGELNRLEDNKNLYLIVDAKHRNDLLKEIANYRIKMGENPFKQMNIFNIERLKVIRVNYTMDVPNYYISKKDGNNNHATGLYKNNTGIYYSVGTKTHGLQVNKAASRIEGQTRPFGKQRAVEIIPINFLNEEEQDYMAMIIHRLRHMALTFDSAIKYPVSMHLAEGVRKYIEIKSMYDEYVEDFDDSILFDGDDGQIEFSLEE